MARTLKPRLEPRGVLWVAVDLQGTEVQVINTRLGLFPRERVAPVEALLSKGWLGEARRRGLRRRLILYDPALRESINAILVGGGFGPLIHVPLFGFCR